MCDLGGANKAAGGAAPAARLLCALALGLLSCLMCAPAPAAEGAAPATTHPARPAGVDWFDGSIAQAFARARQTHQPVFLYWSAAWCPPCQELKVTIFKRRDFLDRLHLFVPVYVDGDAPGAQAIGDRFHVSGYPSVVVLREDQAELERVSGGMDLARYAEVLDLALGQQQTAHDLLAGAAAADPLSAGDCQRLAYNDWEPYAAAGDQAESLEELARSLELAARHCPAQLRVERARLQVTAVEAAANALEMRRSEPAAGAPAARPAPRSGAPLDALLPLVPPILADRALALAVGDTLQRLPAAYFAAAVAAAPGQRAQLRARWFALLDTLAQDPRYSAADQIDTLRCKLTAAKALEPDGRVPPALARSVRQRIDAGVAAEKDAYARASFINSALNALYALGDSERASAILYGEIRSAAHPYYYMSDLAELEEKRGHREAAIDWFARSYRTAQGPATRFQWGVGYVRALVRLTPQDDAAIRAASIEVLGDLDASGDLHGRTRRSLGRLDASLRQWNREGTHAAAVADIRGRMQDICGRLPAGDDAGKDCKDFLGAG